MYNQELQQAVQAARRAGEEVMKIYNSDFEVDYKGENPVTKADLISEKIILKNLCKFDYGILSEETCEENSRLEKPRAWIIDPLDGTSDFVGKTGEFTIMIGLAEREEPVAGVVYQPAKNILYFAVKGQGAFREIDANSKQIRVSRVKRLEQANMLTSRFHLGKQEIKLAEKFNMQTGPCGSAGLKLCMIASGEADLNINASDKTWEYDVCAADIILSEAGGKLTDLVGNKFIYNKKDPRNLQGYVATNGALHDEVIKALNN